MTAPGRSTHGLTEFLVDLANALQRRGIYPSTHPLVRAAVAQAHEQLSALLQTRAVVSVGVARKRLVIDGMAADPDSPWMRELAERLYRHHLAAIKFTRGVREVELANFVGAIAVEPRSGGRPLGLEPTAQLAVWRHVRLYPVAEQELELVEDSEPPHEARARAARLWGGLVAAALAEEEDDALAATGPTAVARAVEARAGDAAYRQVLVGYVLEIVATLGDRGAHELPGLRRNLSQLFLALRPETLGALLDLGGSEPLRQKVLAQALRGLRPTSAAKVVGVAAHSWRRPVAEPLLALVAKSAAWAESGPATARGEALASFREMSGGLATRWDRAVGIAPAPAPTTPAWTPVLVPAIPDGAGGDASEVEPGRLVAIGLAVGDGGPAVLRAVEAMAERAQMHELLDLIAGASPGPATDAVAARAVARDRLLRVMTTEPVDFRLLDRMLPLAGPRAADPMMDALVAATERATRAKLLDRLVQMGPSIGPVVLEKLEDQRWFVQRNVLTLLSRLPDWPEGWTPHVQARHPDARVRREALKMLIRERSTREQAIADALFDPDESNVFLALGACRERCPRMAMPTLLAFIGDEAAGTEMRVMSIRALAAVQDFDALARLLGLVTGRRSLLGRQRLAAKSPEMLAAISGLAQHWKHDDRAAEMVALAAASDDPEIRAAASPRPSRAS